MGNAPFLAVHLADGVLAWPWLLGGWLTAGLLIGYAASGVQEEEVPRIGLLAAVVFIGSSLIHIPIGITSVHPLLNGLAGAVLGRRVPLALFAALLMQALLLGHGGITTLGLNLCVLAIPPLLIRGGLVEHSDSETARRAFLRGFTLGGTIALLTVLANFSALLLGTPAEWQRLSRIILLAHLPIVLLEAALVGLVYRNRSIMNRSNATDKSGRDSLE